MSQEQSARMERYYQFHAKIYDATRWSFLFGRTDIITTTTRYGTPSNILEVGCGTGKNMVALLKQFPQAQVSGLDVSETMLHTARKKLSQAMPNQFSDQVNLIHASYNQPLKPEQPFDLILFSYALTMFNPGWEEAIEAATHDLAPNGLVAVVDFHNSPLPAFKRWMGVNHVRMEGHLQPMLTETFAPQVNEAHAAYGGLWEYLMFVGQKSS